MSGPDFAVVLAYGPGPPVDLIPYFLGLMALIGMAVVAFLARVWIAVASVLMLPFNALLRRLRRKRGKDTPEPEA